MSDDLSSSINTSEERPFLRQRDGFDRQKSNLDANSEEAISRVREIDILFESGVYKSFSRWLQINLGLVITVIVLAFIILFSSSTVDENGLYLLSVLVWAPIQYIIEINAILTKKVNRAFIGMLLIAINLIALVIIEVFLLYMLVDNLVLGDDAHRKVFRGLIEFFIILGICFFGILLFIQLFVNLVGAKRVWESLKERQAIKNLKNQ